MARALGLKEDNPGSFIPETFRRDGGGAPGSGDPVPRTCLCNRTTRAACTFLELIGDEDCHAYWDVDRPHSPPLTGVEAEGIHAATLSASLAGIRLFLGERYGVRNVPDEDFLIAESCTPFKSSFHVILKRRMGGWGPLRARSEFFVTNVDPAALLLVPLAQGGPMHPPIVPSPLNPAVAGAALAWEEVNGVAAAASAPPPGQAAEAVWVAREAVRALEAAGCTSPTGPTAEGASPIPARCTTATTSPSVSCPLEV
ncbi:hypothetical protein CYMTET_50523 [Cymbomonas tetramitiformis]|uniref:Uncharacterized protein n=1 Tax=Cymbomonas tetramitiformis TaxID=36881 RepID=A0AAE0ESR2_9CHLO|nr:hypothetical protein CYMTET_50523 [Cymbomonas tetramitiformis]